MKLILIILKMNVNTEDETINKIEDIIDIQKAYGNYNSRQVAFNLPSECESTISTLSKSLESGLADGALEQKCQKKHKKLRSRVHKYVLPDGISWPSDSDITVLRLKLSTTSPDLKETFGNTLLGDGIHLPDNSSMVNLATLMLQSQTPSKHSFGLEEYYLLPLSSWETKCKKTPNASESTNRFNCTIGVYEATSNVYLTSREYGVSKNAKSKLARFLRLYFCPCCTCLYEMEGLSEEPSTYCSCTKNICNKLPEIN